MDLKLGLKALSIIARVVIKLVRYIFRYGIRVIEKDILLE
jgi:hypothetical protein